MLRALWYAPPVTVQQVCEQLHLNGCGKNALRLKFAKQHGFAAVPSKPPLVVPRTIRGGGICEANDGGDFSQVSECSKICCVRIPSGATRQHPYPYWPLEPKGSLGLCEFAEDFREIGIFLRADRVVRPYGIRRTESSAPTGYGGLENCGVGADDSVGPLGNCEFAADFRKSGLFCQTDVGIGPTNRRTQPAEIQEREIIPAGGRPRTIKLRRRSTH